MYFDEWDAETLSNAVRYVASHTMHERGWLPVHCCNDLEGVFVDGSAGDVELVGEELAGDGGGGRSQRFEDVVRRG